VIGRIPLSTCHCSYSPYPIAYTALSQSTHLGVSVVCVIDYFKQVNDRYGHHAGDEVLKCVAAECHRHLRATDLFAPYGGEEFICVLSEGGPDAALLLAERLRKAIEQTRLEVDGHVIAVTVSLGMAQQLSTESIPLEELIRQADQALYVSKAKGRNRLTMAG
jgi:diguanylate cyclase (GGDEF)-like protein